MTTIDQAQKELEQAQKLLDKAAELERMLRDDTTKPEGGKPAASTDTIDITVVLDRSGSMVGIADDVRGGFDQFVADQRKAPGSAKLTLVQFDTTYEFVHRGIPLDEVPPLELVPRGMTALLDAIGRAIGEAMERVRRDRPEQVLFLILTDGQENSSVECTRPQIFELIERCRKMDWQFIFLGADQAQIAEARGVGIHAGMAMRYSKEPDKMRHAMAMCSDKVGRYRSLKSASALVFSEEDRKEVE